MIMANEHLPPDWRELADARVKHDHQQRKRRDRRRAAEAWERQNALTQADYEREFFGCE
jgi:hypothetical protein